ncbi:MAG: hypothetical protein U0U66_14820 [Cytophagaceae bacterium]
MKTVFLFILLFTSSITLFAQTSDSIDVSKLQEAVLRLKQVIALKKDVLWSQTIGKRIDSFETATYVQCIPLVQVQGNGVLIGLVSRLGQVPLVGEWQPSVKVIWKLVPVREGAGPFTLTVQVDASDTLPEADWQAAKAKMLPWYQHKQYDSVSLCKADLAAAMDAFLDELQLRWGDRYAPKYLFKVRDGYFMNGHTLTLRKDTVGVDSVANIFVVKKEDLSVVTNVRWNPSSRHYYYMAHADSVGLRDYEATIISDGDTVNMTIHIQFLGDEVLNVALQKVRDVFEQALTDAMQVLVDSAQAKEDVYIRNKELTEEMRRQMISKLIAVSGSNTNGNPILIYVSDSTDFVDEVIPEGIRSHSFLGDYINKANAEHLARVAFIFAWTNRQVLAEFIQEPAKRAAFKDAIISDIGTLTADITMSLFTKDQTQIKNFVTDFIIKKVNTTTTAQLSSK